jgi:hypothetical protein
LFVFGGGYGVGGVMVRKFIFVLVLGRKVSGTTYSGWELGDLWDFKFLTFLFLKLGYCGF